MLKLVNQQVVNLDYSGMTRAELQIEALNMARELEEFAGKGDKAARIHEFFTGKQRPGNSPMQALEAWSS